MLHRTVLKYFHTFSNRLKSEPFVQIGPDGEKMCFMLANNLICSISGFPIKATDTWDILLYMTLIIFFSPLASVGAHIVWQPWMYGIPHQMELSSEYNYYTYHMNYAFRTEIPGVLYINRSCRLDIMTWHDLIKKGYWTVIVYFNIGWRKEVFGHLSFNDARNLNLIMIQIPDVSTALKYYPVYFPKARKGSQLMFFLLVLHISLYVLFIHDCNANVPAFIHFLTMY